MFLLRDSNHNNLFMPISDMKSFIKKSLLFALFFILYFISLNSVFLVIIERTDWDFVKRLQSLKFNNPDYEVLVLGTSLAEYGVDTELMSRKDLKSFNLSMVGSSIQTNYIQLNEYLSKYPIKPKYVLLFVNSYLEQFDQAGIQPVIEFTMKNQVYNLKDIPISKFNWAGMELLKKLIRKEYRQTFVSFGQKKCMYFEPDYSKFKNLRLDLNKYKSAFWIGEIAKICQSNRIQFVVVDIPGVKETQNTSEIGPYVLNYGNESSAILYNFNNQAFCTFIDSERDWAGRSHFNKYGAEKFTKIFFDIVFSNQDSRIYTEFISLERPNAIH